MIRKIERVDIMGILKRGFVCGIDTVGGKPVYRLIIIKYDTEKSRVTGVVKTKATEDDMLKQLKAGYDFDNATIDATNTKVVKKTGAFDRFAPVKGIRPYVILAKIMREGSDRAVGYIVANYDGVINKIRITDITKYCEDCKSKGLVQFQNAIYRGIDERKCANIASYGGADMLVELLPAVKNKSVVENKIDTAKNTKNYNEDKDKFTDKQLIVLNDLKLSGYNPSIIANPKFSEKQMVILADAIKNGVNVRPFANPEYKEEIMRYFVDEIKHKRDISMLLNPKYTAAQILEIAKGIDSGVDISKYANPKISDDEMAYIRTGLEQKLWTPAQVKIEEEWNKYLVTKEEEKKVKRKKATKKSEEKANKA